MKISDIVVKSGTFAMLRNILLISSIVFLSVNGDDNTHKVTQFPTLNSLKLSKPASRTPEVGICCCEKNMS